MPAQVQPKAGPSRKKAKKPIKSAKARRSTEAQRIEILEREVMEYIPSDDITTFAGLPISENTKRGLKKAFFVEMTDIQKQSIPVSIKGKDVLGAARTGSGKTLAFLVPVLEVLYRRKWGPTDGLGALVISPTRELAVQIFEVLRSIGGYHSFSAGLVIGGKNLKDERDRLSRMNILVATPGRLLQHMDQTLGFDADNLQLLVLDEADRILDMGFSRILAALLSHLPKTRQTLLFSATQTQSVQDLARLSLKDPVCIGVGEADKSHGSAMPANLEQHYTVCSLDKKLDILWSFIKSHLHCKILVFLSSCKQVRFVFETFCKMHPGIPLLHLHGKQKQNTRLAMYTKFTSTAHAVLFATDIAARGLDFPSVDWVLQVDAPEDAETYIHRVGRTARYDSNGKALLFLLPSEEEGMKAALEKKGIDVQSIKVRPSKTHSVENQLQNLAFKDPEIKYLGQRAFVSYLRSVHLHKDKSIFQLSELPVERFAESLGLPGMPKIKFISKELALKRKNASRSAAEAQADAENERQAMESSDAESDSGASSDSSSDVDVDKASAPAEIQPSVKLSKTNGVRTKYDRMFERKNQNILSEHYTKLVDHATDNQEDDDFITLKRADHDLPESMQKHDEEDISKRKQRLGRAKRTIATGGLAQKLIFDDDGRAHEIYELADADQLYEATGGLEGVKQQGQQFAATQRSKMEIANVVDKQEAKEKKREKKRKRKERERMLDEPGRMVAAAAPLDEDDGYVSPEFELPSEDEDPWQPSPPPAKRHKPSKAQRDELVADNIADDEELALKLLRKH